ncbi:MAG TPA: hypothetical protein IAB12_00190 [Candidatus Ornithospirochaeta avicola]|uniref:beta-lactamase n=1 Tax=Candidatus Ornithospirochaeta avicola TaxID=2840896 RepID=A0A9D1PRV6_9SPIO|nr:hypothetical protein [Candidatus Ornithospirochaeta avicola]
MKKKKIKQSGFYILLISFLLFVLIILRLIYLFYSSGMLNTNYKDIDIATAYYRGTIYDRNNQILALDTSSYEMTIDKRRITGISSFSSLISPFLNMDALEVENMIRKAESDEIVISTSITENNIDQAKRMIEENRLSSVVSLEKRINRNYPSKTHLMAVIGRINEKRNGLYGAEKIFDERLSAPLILSDEAVHGEDITLSVDLNISYLTDLIVESYSSISNKGYIMLAVLSSSDNDMLSLSLSPSTSTSYDEQIIENAVSPSFELDYEKGKNRCEIQNSTSRILSLENGDVCYLYDKDYTIIAYSQDRSIVSALASDTQAILSQI